MGLMNTESVVDCSEQRKRWQFQPGQSGNPAGRKPASAGGAVGGRTRALQVLDEISSKADNVTLLAEAMETAFRKNPLVFFQKYMVQLIPKESLLKIAAEAPKVMRWTTIQESMEADDKTREELRALRTDFPGKDSLILDMIIEEHCPLGALRCQLQGYSYRLPEHKPYIAPRPAQAPGK